ncbi:T9SS type B sorting domain-containing protein [Myroides marinus]|nr:T9SS type B sorting domain-containing protein [Myroides marinus]MDM1533924.1 T9SS type B sorting domain-containing protein [Myroides marinus]MDM1540888.1 T9SS type B sorting domain-containing protein [Myroides marinus]
MWLSLFILSGALSVGAVVGGINPYDYIGNKAIAEVASEQEEPKPEVKIGKPHDIEQALPKNTASGNFRVFLGEAIKARNTGVTIDAEGNAIVPAGYVYSFHNTPNEASQGSNKISEILYIDKFNPASAPLTKYLRVQSVVDPAKVTVTPFLIKVKPEEGATLNDRVTGRPDQYKSADKDGNATFVLLEDKNQLYYGNSNTELYKVDSTVKTKLTDAEVDKFTTNKDQVIEAKIVLDGETAIRQFTLYVETLKVSGVNPVLESVETRRDKDNRYGNFNLKPTIPALLAAGENPDYYTITFHKTTADAIANKEALDITKPIEGAHGTDVTARISYKLAKSANPIVSTAQKVKFTIIDKPTIPALPNVSYCDSKIASYSLTIDGQTTVIADGRPIATEEEMAKPDFDPKGKYSIGYFNSEEDAIANTNKIVGVEVTVKLNEARKIWTRLTSLEDKNFNTAFFYASLGYDDLTTNTSIYNEYIYCNSEDSKNNEFVNLYNLNSYFTPQKPYIKDNPKEENLDVRYYTSLENAKNNNGLSREEASKFKLVLGAPSTTIFARVIMKEGFSCEAEGDDNIKSIKININVTPTVSKYLYPSEDKDVQQLCFDIDENKIKDVELKVKNESQYAIDIQWKIKVWKIDGKGNSYFTYDKIGEIVKVEGGQIGIKSVSVAGDYRADIVFSDTPYTDKTEKKCDISIYWTVKAPPVAVVEDADETGMISSMEVDEKGYAPIVLGVLDGGSKPVTDGYEFAIDNSAFQPSSQFYNVPIGEHVAYARNVKTGCSASIKFSVFGYPKYFTPNGDGYNDTWNIPGLRGHNEARIYIYDKSGRLLKQLSPHTEGWDGTWNGKQMPSTDYWFTVEFVNDYKTPDERNGRKVSYKGHFSLKR